MNYQKWIDKVPSLKGKRYIVLGPTSGIGKELVLSLAKLNAHLVLGCRDLKKASILYEEIKKINSFIEVDYFLYDQSSFESIDSFCQSIKKRYTRIDGIVFNAGVYYAKEDYKTIDGFDLVLQTNYFGPYYCFYKLKDLLINSFSRIVFVSSIAINKAKSMNIETYNSIKRKRMYEASKLFVSQFMVELEKEYKQCSFRLVHPGITSTNILYKDKTGAINLLSLLYHKFLYLFVHKAKKASLVLLKGLIDENENHYIVPRFLSITGFPRNRKIPSFLNKNIIEKTNVILKGVINESSSS